MTKVRQRALRCQYRGLDRWVELGLFKQPPEMCWRCLSKAATTREHRFKHSIFRRIHGRGSYEQGDSSPVRTHAGRTFRVRSSDASTLKYERSLCDGCNNERSRAMDTAFDRFADHVLDNGLRLLDTLTLDLSEAFGEDWSAQTDQLLRAFAKELGCRIRDAGGEVPNQIRLLLGGGWETCPCVSVAVFDNKASRAIDAEQSYLGKSGLYGICDTNKHQYYEVYDLGALRFLIVFNPEDSLADFEEICPSRRHVRIYDETSIPLGPRSWESEDLP